MFSNFCKLLMLMACSAGALRADAVERYRSFFQAARALSMGDAFTAYGQGFESVYYNPAGVARKGGASIKYIDLEMGTTYSSYTYLSENILTFYNLPKMATNMAARPGILHGMFMSFTPQLLTKNLSLGMILKSSWDAQIDSTTADFDIFGTTDLALYLHYGVSLMGGVVKFGVGAKALDRAELDRTFTPTEYATGGLSFGTQWKEGIGYGLDAGVLLTSPTSGLPTLGLAVQDIGNTKLMDRRVLWTGAKGAAGAPANLKQRVNVGTSITVKHAPGVKSVYAFEVKDALHLNLGGTTEHMHAGWEVDFNRVLTLRAGYNQGRYWTAGMGVRLAGFQLELDTWGENLYVYTGQTRELRYYVAKYMLAF